MDLEAQRPGQRGMQLVMREVRRVARRQLEGGRQVANVGAPVVAAYAAEKVRQAYDLMSGKESQKKRSKMAKNKKRSKSKKATKKEKANKRAKVVSARGEVKKVDTRKRSKSSGKKSLKARVKALEATQPKLAVHDYRNIDATYHLTAANQANYKSFVGMTNVIYEAAMNALTFIDRGATPAVDEIDLRNQTYQHEMDIRDIYTAVTIRNNNELDAIVDVYCYVAKTNNNSLPEVMMAAQDDNLGVTSATTNMLTYPSDFSQIAEHWKLESHNRVHLKAGDEFKTNWAKKRFLYDPKLTDTNGNTYVPGSQIWFFRLVGSVTHGSSDDQLVGTGNASIDIVILRKFKIHYMSDASFYRIETVNSLDTQTGVAEQAGPAVEPNQVDA